MGDFEKPMSPSCEGTGGWATMFLLFVEFGRDGNNHAPSLCLGEALLLEEDADPPVVDKIHKHPSAVADDGINAFQH